MSNDSYFIPQKMVNRPYTAGVMLRDVPSADGKIYKNQDVCILEMGVGVDGNTGMYRKAVVSCYVPGMSIPADHPMGGLQIIAADAVLIPYFCDCWGNEYTDINGQDLYTAIYRYTHGKSIISVQEFLEGD